MNPCSQPTLISTEIPLPALISASAKPSRSTSPSGHHDPHLPSQLRSFEIKLNSLQQYFSGLHENQSILINNQHAVLQVLTTMTLPPYLAIHLAPLYSLFNLSPIVATDPTVPTDPLHPQPSPTVPPLHLSPPPPKQPHGRASHANTCPPSSKRRPYHSFKSSNITLLLYPIHQLHSSIPYDFLLPYDLLLLLHALMSPPTQQPVYRYPLSYAQATARGHRQPSTDTLAPPSTQISMSPTDPPSLLLQPVSTKYRSAARPRETDLVCMPCNRGSVLLPDLRCEHPPGSSSYPTLRDLLPHDLFGATTTLSPFYLKTSSGAWQPTTGARTSSCEQRVSTDFSRNNNSFSSNMPSGGYQHYP